ncbi:MAG: hypothetical protein KKH06_02870 [Gammaproteobacteria bacterium]|nr:hypothetical protein [Gammaproteobacteria bacterium]
MFFGNKKHKRDTGIEKFTNSSEQMTYRLPEHIKLRHFTITRVLLEKLNNKEPLSHIEEKELGCTDAKICAMRMDGDLYLCTNQQLFKRVKEMQMRHICENGAHKILFPNLLKKDPNYNLAVAVKKELEKYLKPIMVYTETTNQLSKTLRA